MTISSTDSKAIFTADGIVVAYPYSFRADNDSDIEVYLDTAKQSTGYTLVRAGDDIGGTVTFDTPPADQVEVTLLRVIPLTQGTDYQPYDAFPAETHEDALDKLTMISQQHEEVLSRALTEPIGTPDQPEEGYQHNLTTLRDAANAHPMKAIAGSAYCSFDGSIASPAVVNGHNISGIVKDATGVYTLSFTTPLAHANFIVTGLSGDNGTNNGKQMMITGRTTTTFRISMLSYNGNPADADTINVLVVGG